MIFRDKRLNSRVSFINFAVVYIPILKSTTFMLCCLIFTLFTFHKITMMYFFDKFWFLVIWRLLCLCTSCLLRPLWYLKFYGKKDGACSLLSLKVGAWPWLSKLVELHSNGISHVPLGNLITLLCTSLLFFCIWNCFSVWQFPLLLLHTNYPIHVSFYYSFVMSFVCCLVWTIFLDSRSLCQL